MTSDNIPKWCKEHHCIKMHKCDYEGLQVWAFSPGPAGIKMLYCHRCITKEEMEKETIPQMIQRRKRRK